jgi:arsenical-resistance protein 2
MELTQEKGNTAPWYAVYSTPRHTQPGSLTREELLGMIKSGDSLAGRDFVLIDLRRNDHEVPSSPRWPASWRLLAEARDD